MDDEWLKIADAYTDNDDESFIEPDYENELSKLIFTFVSNNNEGKMRNVANCWSQMGLPKKYRERRLNEIINVFGDICEKIEKTEMKSLNDLINIKESKIKEINHLNEDLGEKPYVPVIDLPLLVLAKNIHYKCEELRKLKDIRMKEWTEINSVNVNLSHRLGIAVEHIRTTTKIPCSIDVQKLTEYVAGLQDTFEKRKKKFLYMKKLITKLFKDLEKTIDEFEHKVILADVNEFILSQDNLNRMDELHASLENQIEKNNMQRIALSTKLNNLFERLEIDQEERDKFNFNPNDSRPSTLRKLEVEIERLEILKKENMGLFICKLRPEIVKLWEKCYVGTRYRDYFNDYLNDNDFNDELLEIHEKEVDRLKLFYEDNIKLISKLEAHKVDWQRFRELDQKMRDPSRFNNRGGTLLKEEAARKKLQRGLPKLEAEITELSRKWSETHDNEQFNIFDESIETYFRNIWEDFNNEKENEKKNRQQVKKNEIEAAKKGRTVPPSSASKTPTKRFANNLNQIPSSGNKMRKLNPLSPEKNKNDNIMKKPNARAKLEFNKEPSKSKSKIVKPVIANKIAKKETATTSSETFICEDDFQKTLKQRKDSFMNSTECQ